MNSQQTTGLFWKIALSDAIGVALLLTLPSAFADSGGQSQAGASDAPASTAATRSNDGQNGQGHASADGQNNGNGYANDQGDGNTRASDDGKDGHSGEGSDDNQERGDAGGQSSTVSTKPQKMTHACSLTSLVTTATSSAQTPTIYATRFTSNDWQGDVVAYTMTAGGTITNLWDAANQLTDSSGRHIYTFNGEDGVAFRWDQLSQGERTYLDSGLSSISSPWANGDTSGHSSSENEDSSRSQSNQDHSNSEQESGDSSDQGYSASDSQNYSSDNSGGDGQGTSASNLVSWLSGNRTMEGTLYRTRGFSVLGDIIHSDPLWIGDQSYGYSSTPTMPGSAQYQHYLNQKQSGDGLLVVGANDGMLHAFDAKTGHEDFAFVPEGVYPSLGELANPAYGTGKAGAPPHHYYVDGSATAADAYLDGQWNTFVVGTLGAGGRGVFGLNVTPWLTQSTASNSASGLVKWDDWAGPDQLPSNTDSCSKDGGWTQGGGIARDLGYTLPRATIAKMNNGEWAALVPNGYASPCGNAALFILNLQTGKVIREIVADGGPADGLSSIMAVDAGHDGTADYIYAGDLQGNLWKFDVHSADPSAWSVSRLFQAKDQDGRPQPITAAPMMANDPDGGIMIYFGTGANFSINRGFSPTNNEDHTVGANNPNNDNNGNDNGDRDADESQGTGGSLTAAISYPNTSAKGQRESFYAIHDPDVANMNESVSRDQLSPAGSATASTAISGAGWYMDLQHGDGQWGVVGAAQLRHGNVIFNAIKLDAPLNACAERSGQLQVLDAANGSSVSKEVASTANVPTSVAVDEGSTESIISSITTPPGAGSKPDAHQATVDLSNTHTCINPKGCRLSWQQLK